MNRMIAASAAGLALAYAGFAHAGASAATTPQGGDQGWKGTASVDTSVSYDDNILAAPTNPTSDTVFTVTPALGAHYQDDKSTLDVHARAIFTRYASNGGENSEQYAIGGDGSYRAGLARLFGGAGWEQDVEDRKSKNTRRDTVSPISSYVTRADGGLSGDLGALRLTGEVKYAGYDFQNAVSRTGAFVLQDDRDRSVYEEKVRADLSPDKAVSFFIKGELKQVDYALAPPASRHNRNSHGYEIDAGATFKMASTLTGEASVGYVKRFFPDPVLPDVGDLALDASLTWSAAKQTSIQFTLSRSIEEDVQANSSAYVATSAGTTVTQNVGSKVTLTGNFSYEWDSHKGVDRSDRELDGGLAADFHLTSHVDLGASWDHSEELSSGAAKQPGYTDNTFMAHIRLNL